MEMGGMSTMDSAEFKVSKPNNADMMKGIRKAKMQRQVMADPSLAGKLVATEATGTYNAKGDIVQAASTDLGEA